MAMKEVFVFIGQMISRSAISVPRPKWIYIERDWCLFDSIDAILRR